MTIQHWRVWYGRAYTCFIPLWSCYCIPVLWAVVVVVQSIIQWHLWVDIYPSIKCMWSCWSFCQWRHPCPLHIAWNLHLSSVDALADIHRRSHSFPFIHPREVFLAWHWVITRPSSSCGIVLLSLPWGVDLTGVGLVYPSHTWQTPMHKGTPASDTMQRSWLWCRMYECLCWSFTLYKEMSIVYLMYYFMRLVLPSALIFLFPWKASALTRTR